MLRPATVLVERRACTATRAHKVRERSGRHAAAQAVKIADENAVSAAPFRAMRHVLGDVGCSAAIELLKAKTGASKRAAAF